VLITRPWPYEIERLKLKRLRFEGHRAHAKRGEQMPTTGQVAKQEGRLRLLLKEAYWRSDDEVAVAATML